MKRKLATLATSAILVAALIGLMIPVQALGTPFTIYGQVFDSDGTTPVDGVTVTVTNLATGSSVTPEVTASGGWYSVNLGNLQPNEAHAAGDNIEISADDGAGKTSTMVVPRAASSPQLVNLVLQPAETYSLTISSTAGGSVTTPGEDTFTYDKGTVVNLVATPDADYMFVSWTGDVSTLANVNAATTTITMNGDYEIVANFVEIPPQYELTVTSTAGGSVTAPGEGTFTYDEGTVVSLKAVAATGYDFESWKGDVGTIANANAATTTITMNGDYEIVANFEEEEEVVRRGGGAYTPADSDNDGFTDVEEILAGTDPNDSKDYPGAKETTPTPPPATPTRAPATPVPATPTPEPPGFEALLAITGLLAIAFVILKRKQ
jgi:hypothetical protein